jgi:hypothetical protein
MKPVIEHWIKLCSFNRTRAGGTSSFSFTVKLRNHFFSTRYLAYGIKDLKDEKVLGFLAVSWLKDELDHSMNEKIALIAYTFMLLSRMLMINWWCCGVELAYLYTAHHVPCYPNVSRDLDAGWGRLRNAVWFVGFARYLFLFVRTRNWKKWNVLFYTLYIDAFYQEVYIVAKGKKYTKKRKNLLFHNKNYLNKFVARNGIYKEDLR